MALATRGERGVPLSALCPKFLHSNSTSHTWPFSAIAELIDNAYDPDVNASKFWIDKTQVNNEDILTFMDNGNGLDYEKMHKMLSFGYSDKPADNGKHPIGVYGNGFKSGSMRLGRDALVLSKSENAVCVGMLSQSYLEAIKAEQIVVPIVSFQCSSHSSDGSLTWDQLRACDDHKASLEDILKYSLFNTVEQLLTELKVIVSTCSTGATGTRIIIWNLRRTSSGQTEYYFDDRYDIKIPSDVYETEKKIYKRPERHQNSIPDTDLSLRAYCAVLYLKPDMQIIIRGQKVKSQLISKSLAHTVKDNYKPNFLKNKCIPITFGYNTKSKDHYGIMMYHKNRLIKAYERVGCQNQANNKGVGVIGVIECNFLDPTHNKQDFDNTDSYRKTMNNLAIKLEEYWTEMKHKKDTMDPNNNAEDIEKRPDQNWVQCDRCRKWRKLPDGIECSLLPEEWYCALNPDPQFRSCSIEQEREDSEDDEPYQKIYKQQKKKQQEENARKKKEEEQKMAEQEKVRLTEARREKLKQMALRSARRSPDVAGPSPTGHATRAMARDSPLLTSPQPSISSLPDTSTPPSDILPTISNVFSLSTPSRKKRTMPRTLARENKRPRLNDTLGNPAGPDSPALEEGSSSSSTSTFVPSDYDANDDIMILETNSTPRPNSSGDPAKVKLEQSSLSMEYCDEAAADGLDTPPNNGTVRTGSSSATAIDPIPLLAHVLQTVQASITTQTESPTKVKEEQEGRGIKEELGRDGPEERRDRGIRRGQEKNTEQEERREEPWCNMEVTKDASTNPKHGSHMEENEALSGTDKGPSYPGPSGADPQFDFQNMVEAQKQQDELLKLMQAAALERDSYREQVQKLTSQLREMESTLQQLHKNPVKTEHFHQACQTEGQGGEGAEGRQAGGEGEQEAGRDGQFYKRLYEQAKLEAEELSREKEAWLAGGHGKSSTTLKEVESPMSDEIAQQVDFLLLSLDERNEERDHLQNKVQHLEEEKTNLISYCERLQRDLEKQRAEAERQGVVSGPRSGGNQTGAARPEGVDEGESGTVSASEGAGRLRNLRMKVGRLLASIVPDLDLKEVDYESDVIDDIVEQVLPEVASTMLGGGGTGC